MPPCTPSEFALRWPGTLRPIRFPHPNPALPAAALELLAEPGLPLAITITGGDEATLRFESQAAPFATAWKRDLQRGFLPLVDGFAIGEMPPSWTRFWHLGERRFRLEAAAMMDEKHDDGLGGRSRDRRTVSSANRWARPLCALLPRELAAAPIPDDVREAVQLARALTSPKALARQFQRIDKLVRQLEDDQIAVIDAFLVNPKVAKEPPRPDPALEAWCDRLIAEGDVALDAWLAEHPGADRQRLRTLTRNARDNSAARRRALRDALVP